MTIVLKFDIRECAIHAPDGYYYHPEELKTTFLEWLLDQPICVNGGNNEAKALRYNEKEFMLFLNTVMLGNSCEKAYLLSEASKIRGPKIRICF